MVSDIQTESLDMSVFGHLKAVNNETSPKPGFVQLIFDTGTEMFIPNDLFLSINMKFLLEEKDGR